MIEIKTSQTAFPEDQPREVLFRIDDVPYTIPVEVPATFSLQAAEYTRQHGEAAVTAWILEKLLGEEGWRALRTCDAVTKSQLRAIMKICNDRVFGGMEEEGKG